MVEQCRRLDGRVVVRGRDGAPERLRSGLAGVGAFAVGVTAATLVTVRVAAAVLFPGRLSAVAVRPPAVTDLAVVAPLVAPLLAVYAVGALGFLVSWRRRYDVRVEVRESLLRWD